MALLDKNGNEIVVGALVRHGERRRLGRVEDVELVGAGAGADLPGSSVDSGEDDAEVREVGGG